MASKLQRSKGVPVDVDSLRLGKVLEKTKCSALIKRSALGEVGNKLHNVTKTNSGKEVTATHAQSVLSNKPVVTTQKTLTLKNKENEPNGVGKRIQKLIRSPVPLLNRVIEEKPKAKSYSSKKLFDVDPDQADKNEPLLVPEYVRDIYAYLRKLEETFTIEEDFLNGHRTNAHMRSILVNWMVDVHTNFKFLLETLHLSVAIVDRYLQVNKSVGRDTLQLVGTSAMLVASKYEEIYSPDLDDFVYICDDTFSKKEILKMEQNILVKLDWNLGRPLSLHFLRRFSKIAKVQTDYHVLGKYLLELCLLDSNLCYVNPSLQAAAALCLSISILNEYKNPAEAWTETLEYNVSLTYSDFKSIIYSLAQTLLNAETSRYQSIRKKYGSPKYCKISSNPKLTGRLTKCLALKGKQSLERKSVPKQMAS